MNIISLLFQHLYIITIYKLSTELNPKTLYSVHSSLEDMGLIKKLDRAEYIINDIFLNIILQQKDDEYISISNLEKLS